MTITTSPSDRFEYEEHGIRASFRLMSGRETVHFHEGFSQDSDGNVKIKPRTLTEVVKAAVDEVHGFTNPDGTERVIKRRTTETVLGRQIKVMRDEDLDLLNQPQLMGLFQEICAKSAGPDEDDLGKSQ